MSCTGAAAARLPIIRAARLRTPEHTQLRLGAVVHDGGVTTVVLKTLRTTPESMNFAVVCRSDAASWHARVPWRVGSLRALFLWAAHVWARAPTRGQHSDFLSAYRAWRARGGAPRCIVPALNWRVGSVQARSAAAHEASMHMQLHAFAPPILRSGLLLVARTAKSMNASLDDASSVCATDTDEADSTTTTGHSRADGDGLDYPWFQTTLVMPLCACTLGDAIARLPLADLQAIVGQVLWTLHAAGEAMAFLHRDLRPDNVFLRGADAGSMGVHGYGWAALRGRWHAALGDFEASSARLGGVYYMRADLPRDAAWGGLHELTHHARGYDVATLFGVMVADDAFADDTTRRWAQTCLEWLTDAFGLVLTSEGRPVGRTHFTPADALELLLPLAGGAWARAT